MTSDTGSPGCGGAGPPPEESQSELTKIVRNTVDEGEVIGVKGFYVVRSHEGPFKVIPKGRLGAVETFEPGAYPTVSVLSRHLSEIADAWEVMAEHERTVAAGPPLEELDGG